jgi:hypothetical protein
VRMAEHEGTPVVEAVITVSVPPYLLLRQVLQMLTQLARDAKNVELLVLRHQVAVLR